MRPVTLPATFRHFEYGGCGTVVGGAFIVPMVVGASRGLASALELPLAPTVAAGVAVGLALVAWLTFFFSGDNVIVVDRLGIKATTQSKLGPFRGKLHTLVDAQWANVSRVEDITSVRVTSRGGTHKHFKLRIGDAEIDNALLNCGQRDGKYLELIEAVRAAIGDRLVETTDLGDLDSAVRQIARDEAGKGASK